MRIKEHKDACIHRSTEKSAVSDYAWIYHHPILWDEVQIVDSARRHDILQVKEALHIYHIRSIRRCTRIVAALLPGVITTVMALLKPYPY